MVGILGSIREGTRHKMRGWALALHPTLVALVTGQPAGFWSLQCLMPNCATS